MGHLSKLRYKVGYVWAWRVRHWWLDTPAGLQARVSALCLALLGTICAVAGAAVAAANPAPPHAPHQSIVWVVVYLIIAIVLAILAIVLAPKPKQPPAQKGTAPTTDDGQSVRRHYGTGWVDDSFLLAWKLMGTEPIKASGGK
jgi:hypothetical protein